jgi:hypothetical protein
MTHARQSHEHPLPLPARWQNLARLSFVLQRVEQAGLAPDPAQYRRLVQQITNELVERPAHADDPVFQQLLSGFPATAELYENLRYPVAGLCLSPLDRSVQTEELARQALRGLTLARRHLHPGGG